MSAPRRFGEPRRVGEFLPDDLGQQREIDCPSGCGGRLSQVKMLRDWTPAKCAACLGGDARDLGDRRTDPGPGAEQLRQERGRLQALEIPPKYAGATLDSFALMGDEENHKRQSRLLVMARRYLALWPEVPEVVVLRGGPGTGKGHFAWSIAKQVVTLHGARARVVKLPDAIRDLREAWRSEGGPTEAQRLARYRSPDLLIIDEVSRHAFYGEPHRHLYDLVDHRIEQCQPTILTTNETPQGLADFLGPALTSRVAGVGLWEFGVVDYRLARLPAA